MTVLVMLALAGLVVMILTAVVIGVTDSAQRGAWRRIADERRRSWERRQRQLHGDRFHVDAWGDEDTD
ncbi:hypothetical protein ACLFMI_04840 [Pseudonocardia nantongensis]|uniref:hypothetical protein n=1 Tax=Pseudonocardia nantongensis TaxID=1181885 RepID=UPI00397A21FB